LVFDAPAAAMPEGITALHLSAHGPAATRYGAAAGDVVLIRPDQHISARWHRPTQAAIAQARRTALCLP